MSNQAPVYYRGLIERNMETIRRKLAAEFGCDAEEIAITRNASESLQIAQDGLDLKAGDEVLTTHQDYPRMLTTWDQRQRRDKIKVTRIQFPVPTTQDDLYQRLESAITPRTRVLHICHVTNITGQLFPVQRLCRMARQRGITSIVDAAHSVAHFPFKLTARPATSGSSSRSGPPRSRRRLQSVRRLRFTRLSVSRTRQRACGI
jgi:selenocysteine lyase/cysteine desulfurase